MSGASADQAGLSLVEQLIAVALVAILAVALLYGLSGGTLGVGVVDEQVTAGNVATSALEGVKRGAYINGTSAYTPTVTAPPGYELRVSVSPVLTGVQWVTATVSHNGRVAAQVSDYKVNR